MADLVVPHRDGGQSYVYLNDGKGAFADDRRIPFGPSDATIRAAEVADFDKDGAPDIVTIDDTHRAVGVHFGRRDGLFGRSVGVDNGEAIPYALTIANKGVVQAVRDDASLRAGVNTYEGRLTSEAVAHSQGREHTAVDRLL